MGDPAAGGRHFSRSHLALAALTVLGLTLRLVHLGRFEMWVDEAATWWFARLVWTEGASLLASAEPTPPVYYAFIGLWMRLFGEAEWILRLPSALAGAATIPLLYDLGRRLFSGRVGWMAAVLLTVHPLHVFYSREARVYALLLCLTCALFLTLWRALERETWGSWSLFGGCLVAICSLHVSGFFLGITIGLQILVLGRSWRGRWRGLLVAALAGMTLVPYVGWALPQLEGSGAAWSVENMYRALPEEGRLGRSLEMQLIGADYFVYLRQMDRPPTPVVLRWWALLSSLVLLILALRRRADQRAVVFLALGWMVSILVPWTLSRTWQTFFHPGRHDLYTVGVVMVLLAAGLDRLTRPEDWPGNVAWRKPLLLFCVAGLALGAFFRLFMLHTQPVDERNRSKGQWLAQQAEATDQIVAMGILRPIMTHSLLAHGNRTPMVSFPPSTDQHPGWSDDRSLLEDMPALQQEAKRMASSFVEHALDSEDPGRLFVLLRSYQHVGDRASVSWWVDRQLLDALQLYGWRRQDLPESESFSIAIFEPPSPPTHGRESQTEEASP